MQVLHKLRRLPEQLIDFLALESVLKDSLSGGRNSQRLWRQFEVSGALFDEALRKFPALNRTAVVSFVWHLGLRTSGQPCLHSCCAVMVCVPFFFDRRAILS